MTLATPATPAARIEASLLDRAARRFFDPVTARAARSVLRAPFAPGADRRMLIYHHPSPICWANTYPFLHQAGALSAAYGASIRALPISRLLEQGRKRPADLVLIQPWFTEDPQKLGDAIAAYRDQVPQARIVFIDSFAHTDLRLGRHVAPHIDLYLRKALFRDRQEFLRPRLGDTNLTEYYMRLYGIEEGEPVDWQVPPALLDRLGLIQNFLMAPALSAGFRGPRPDVANRSIDLNLRIAMKGTPWYSAMRRHAMQAARDLPGVSMTTEERIPHSQFMTELHQSRLCWSPFGYGELCWRDIEAFLTGAVLIKPDMGHLDTLPDLYRPGETYLPVKWDFSDLEKVVRDALANPEMLTHMAATAFDACRDYLQDQQFVRDLGIVFDQGASAR